MSISGIARKYTLTSGKTSRLVQDQGSWIPYDTSKVDFETNSLTIVLSRASLTCIYAKLSLYWPISCHLYLYEEWSAVHRAREEVDVMASRSGYSDDLVQMMGYLGVGWNWWEIRQCCFVTGVYHNRLYSNYFFCLLKYLHELHLTAENTNRCIFLSFFSHYSLW